MTHHQFAATAAKRALRLSPLALVAVALLFIAALVSAQGGRTYQPRYDMTYGVAITGRVFYECTRAQITYGNNKATELRINRQTNITNAYANMEIIDNFPPTPPAPSRSRLQTVIGWITYVVELTAYNINNYKNYNSQSIIDGIWSDYRDKLRNLDSEMHDRTGSCARAQARLNSSQAGSAGMIYSYGVTWYGFNNWLGMPTRLLKNEPRKHVYMECVANC